MSFAQPAEESGPTSNARFRIVPLLLLAAALALAWASGAAGELRLDRLIVRRDELAALVAAHPFASAGLYLFTYCIVAAIGVPGAALLTILGGAMFGVAAGALLAVTGASAGGTLFFLAASSSLGGWMRGRISGGRLARFAEGFRRDAASYLLFLRLVAIFPFWLVNLATALIGVPLRTFIWTTAAGIAPAALLFALVGASMDGALIALRQGQAACVAAGGESCPLVSSALTLLRPEMILALAGLGLLALAPVAARHRRRARQEARLEE